MPLASTDQPTTKQRPALVLSDAKAFNNQAAYPPDKPLADLTKKNSIKHWIKFLRR